MIRTRHHQASLWTAVLAEEAEELWEPWMRTADRLLDDEHLVDRVFEAQAKRFLKSRTRGRKQTPAEVVLRPLILKHVRVCSAKTQRHEELGLRFTGSIDPDASVLNFRMPRPSTAIQAAKGTASPRP